MTTIYVFNIMTGYQPWWINITRYLGTGDDPVDYCANEEELIQQYGGVFHRGVENDPKSFKSLYFSYVTFEKDSDATAFMLRWS